jgi:hypothetical protein
MKKNLLLVFILFSGFLSAQEPTQPKRGTIVIEKKGNIHSVVFDNVNFRLLAIDHSGNILDSAIVSFRIKTTILGIAHDEPTMGSFLSKELQKKLSRIDSGTILYFSEIKVKDKYGNVINWADFKSKMGFSYEREEE